MQAHMSVNHMDAYCLQRPEQDCGSPGIGILVVRGHVGAQNLTSKGGQRYVLTHSQKVFC